MTRHGSARVPGRGSAGGTQAGGGQHDGTAFDESPTVPFPVVDPDRSAGARRRGEHGPRSNAEVEGTTGVDRTSAPRSPRPSTRDRARRHDQGRQEPGPPADPGPAQGQVQGHGHGHGHGHGPAIPAGRRVRVLLAVLLVPCALATLVGLVVLRPTDGAASAGAPLQQPVRGQVTAVRTTDCSPGDGQGRCVALIVALTDGPRAGRDLVQIVPLEPATPRFAAGDPVVLGWSGGNPDDPGSYQIVDFQRGGALAWLAVLFAAAVLVLGRWRGLAALAALAVTFAVLLLFVLPAILDGRSPLAVAVVGSGVIMFAVLYLTHGPSARTSTAVLGTLVSLALIGVLGAAFSAAARLTGLDDQATALVASLDAGVDARGLLLAGMVIGALGVLDDVTVTQTSAVWELRRANPRLGARALFRSAMRIGRDHVASAVNTLVLAYAGASLPLLLLFSLSGRSLAEVATSQDVATEIVRTLVGSIGLVASVPVTTGVAALVASREERGTRPGPGSRRGPAMRREPVAVGVDDLPSSRDRGERASMARAAAGTPRRRRSPADDRNPRASAAARTATGNRES